MKRDTKVLLWVDILSGLALVVFLAWKYMPGFPHWEPAPPPTPPPAAQPAPGPQPEPALPAPPAAETPVTATAPVKKGEPVAALADSEGNVKARSAGSSAWQDVHQQVPLYGDDVIRTHDKASATLSFAADGVIHVDQNSLVVLHPHRKGAQGDEITLSVLPGDFLDRLEAAPASERDKEFQTAVAKTEVTIRTVRETGAKGGKTRVAVKSLPGQATGVQSLAGTLKVVSPRGEEVILKEKMVTRVGGEALLVKPHALLAAPDLIYPADGATYGFQRKAPRVEVKWKAVQDARSYRVLVASDRDFKHLFADETVDKPALTVANLSPGTYFWRVRVQDADGFDSPYSAARSLRTFEDDSPPKLAILSPAEMYVSPGPKVDLKGKTETGARLKVNGQKVQVGEDGSFTYPLVLKEGVNLVTIEAIDPAGNSEYGKRVITYKGTKRSTAATSSRN
jgi:hypothetical protein